MTTVIYEDIVVQHVQCQPCNHFYIPPGHCNHFYIPPGHCNHFYKPGHCNHFYIPPGHCNHFYKPPGHCFSKPLSQNIFNFKGFNQILTPLLNQTERFRYFVLILLNTVFTFLDVSTGKTNCVTKFEYRIEYYSLNKLNPTEVFCVFFSVPLLSVLRDHLFFSSPPQQPMTSDFEGFLSQILSIIFFVLSLFFRKSQYFPF